MSQSPTVPTAAHTREQSAGTTVVEDGKATKLLDALDDDDCRTILAATTGEALSANEISEACELPLSTAYRKLDILTEVGLIEERTRIGTSGKHASEFIRLVEDVTVSITADGDATLELSRCEDDDSVLAR